MKPGVTFYVHAVEVGMQFVQASGFVNYGNAIDTTNGLSSSECAARCTFNELCVGAQLFYSNPTTNCFLFSAFGSTNQIGPGSTLLLPAGPAGCMNRYAHGLCITSIPFNVIPDFDFILNDMQPKPNPSIQDAYTACDSNIPCIGFNSDKYTKNGFNNPTVKSGYKFYVHAVRFGMQFVKIPNLNMISRSQLSLASFASLSPSDCAAQCTFTVGCVGALLELSDDNKIWTCYLISAFSKFSILGPHAGQVVRYALIPAGPGGCMSKNADICITSRYNMIPGFDFKLNDIESTPSDSLQSTYAKCQADFSCVGFNTDKYYKRDFANPSVDNKDLNFFVHAVEFGMEFYQIKGWRIDSQNFITPFASNPTECLYKCSITPLCVTAIFDGNNYCYLKSHFTTPIADTSGFNTMFLPAGRGGCNDKVTAVYDCIESIPLYSRIPNFNFNGSFILTATDMNQAYLECQKNSNCTGFNTKGSCYMSFSKPNIMKGVDTFVHFPSYGMQFIRVPGWDNNGTNLPQSGDFIIDSSTCAWQCSVTPNCVGAISDNRHKCVLKSVWKEPFATTNTNFSMLVPAGPGGCHDSVIDAGNCITPVPLCREYLPGSSLVAILFNTEATFIQLSKSLFSDPRNQDYINNGKAFLETFLKIEVDFNGDNIITTQEVVDALQFRSVEATGLATNFDVWICKTSENCAGHAVSIDIVTQEALSCFQYSKKHLFDCSGVSIITNMQSAFPKFDDNALCKLSGQSWYPETYHKPITNWTFTPPSTPTGQANIGKFGRVCVYSNGYRIQGPPFNTEEISTGIVSTFQDPNRDKNVTSFRRIYCVHVTLNDGSSSYECTQGLFHVSLLLYTPSEYRPIINFHFIQDGTPIDLTARLTQNGVIFSYLDTSASESEFDIYFGNLGSKDSDKTFSVGINYPSRGCGRISQHISFADKVNMNSVGKIVEYGIRAIQTVTNMDDVSKPVFEDQLTSMSKHLYRIPYLVFVSGTVKTKSGVGVENVTISYCHIDRNTGANDINSAWCPIASFVTDKLGQWQGQIEVSDINWINKIENFNITAFHNQTMKNDQYVIHSFQPETQNIAIGHLEKSIVTITDTTGISIFGSIQFDPLTMDGGSYFCPFANVPVVMVQGNGQVVKTSSNEGGNFSFSVTQSDSITIYIPPFNGFEWRSIMSVPGVSSADFSTPANFYSYTDRAATPSVHDFLYNAVTDDGGHWIKVLEKINGIVMVNEGSQVTNGVFQQFGIGNIKYVVNGKIYNYYKRLSFKTLFDFYANFAITWTNHSNVLNKDFKMYTTYTDLQLDINSWQYCDYNIPNVGYPADCAINVNTSMPNLWTGFGINTLISNPQNTEIWIQVFPNSKPYTTDLIRNGDFEEYGTNFSKYGSNVSSYGIPIDWQLISKENANVVYSIQAADVSNAVSSIVQMDQFKNEIGSYCGISYVLIIKPPGKPFGGIQQLIYIPGGT